MTVGFVSLGCAKNQVSSEQMLFLLSEAGYDITTSVDNVDVVVVNTCGFIESAKKEAIAELLELAQLKSEGRIGKILAVGCLAQRYQTELLEELPEVDGVVGCGSFGDIVIAVDRVLKGDTPKMFDDLDAPLEEVGRVLTTADYWAYLKIAEGCDHRCAYCVIPFLRGRFRSRRMEDVLDEARALAEEGVRELIVVAQDTSRYGLDLYGRRRLPELLTRLCDIDGLTWIRVHYLYPDEVTDELIDVFARQKKLIRYFDIPIQHCNDGILNAMRRRGDHAYLDDLLTKIRARVPGAVLRTSIITGLPGEGEAEFEELCVFLKKHRMERAGCFAFSPEEGTKAAEMDYPDREVAERRAEIIGELQSRIMDDYNADKLGKIMTVLCEGYDRLAEIHYGRTYADSPEIDGKVFFSSPRRVRAGTFVDVLMEDVLDGDLIGTACAEDEA